MGEYGITLRGPKSGPFFKPDIYESWLTKRHQAISVNQRMQGNEGRKGVHLRVHFVAKETMA